MSKYHSIILSELDAGRRLDRLVRKYLTKARVSVLYRAIRKGDVRLNGLKVSPETLTLAGDILEIYKPLLAWAREYGSSSSLTPQIVFEDEDFLIINKDLGVLVAPAGEKEQQETLNDWVLTYKSSLYKSSLAFTPAPLHRLDRNTTGLLVFSLSLRGAQNFCLALKRKQIKKTYLALVEGHSPKFFDWSSYLGYDHKQRKAFLDEQGSLALTKGSTLASYQGISLVKINIQTGVTHQIRACAQIHGFPLVGDKKYGSYSCQSSEPFYFLHAYKLKFPEHWSLKNKEFKASLPLAWKKKLVSWNVFDRLEKDL